MNKKDGERVTNIINSFLNDNMGQVITKWNAPTLGQAIKFTIDDIVAKDNKDFNELEDIRKKIEEVNNKEKENLKIINKRETSNK